MSRPFRLLLLAACAAAAAGLPPTGVAREDAAAPPRGLRASAPAVAGSPSDARLRPVHLSSTVAPVRAGSVSGRVSVRRPAPRRSASRYSGRRSASRAVQALPVLVWVEGPVAEPGPPGRYEMAQEDTAFVPAALLVPPGSTVSFLNGDSFFHNVFSYSSAARFDLGRYPRGEAKEVTFTEPGVVKVYCEVHDFMRAVVVVTENPFHAIVGEDGSFRIDGIPAGEHTLVFWDADLDPVERTVLVGEGEVATVEVELR